MIVISTCGNRGGTHTCIYGRCTQRRRQTDRNNKQGKRKTLILILSVSLTVNHSSPHISTQPLPLPPILCGYQAGAEGLSPADSGSSEGWGGVGGVAGGWVEVGVNVCARMCVSMCANRGSGTRKLTPLPQIWRSEVRGSRMTGVPQNHTTAACVPPLPPHTHTHTPGALKYPQVQNNVLICVLIDAAGSMWHQV